MNYTDYNSQYCELLSKDIAGINELGRLRKKLYEIEQENIEAIINSCLLTFNPEYDKDSLSGLLFYESNILAEYLKKQIKKEIEKLDKEG